MTDSLRDHQQARESHRRSKQRQRRLRFKPGDRVTCKYQVEAYYSGYGGNPYWWFKPGMVGVVKSIAPKVTRQLHLDPKSPEYDCGDEFLVVDYEDPECGGTVRRTGLHFCNAVRVKEPKKKEGEE